MTLHPESVLVGFMLLAIMAFLLVSLMQYAGQPILRRLSYWTFNRRGFEKLGRPIRVRPGNTPYEQWLSNAKCSIPVHECVHIDDVRSIALQPWEQVGKDIR